MKLPTILDTTAWASCQSRIFAGQAKPVEAYSYHGLYEAQKVIAVTNLVLRQQVIYWKLSGHIIPESVDDFHSLRRNGFWVEGPGYLDYVKDAFVWAGGGSMPLAVTSMEENYRALAAPDGTFCLPETRPSFTVEPLQDPPDYHADPSYIVKRWKDSAGKVTKLLLIGVETEFSHRANLHCRPVGFGVWKDGKWVARCSPYFGYDTGDSLLDEADRGNTVPRHVFDPTWRINPPRITVDIQPNRYTVKYRPAGLWGWMSSVTRVYAIARETVMVSDNNSVVWTG